MWINKRINFEKRFCLKFLNSFNSAKRAIQLIYFALWAFRVIDSEMCLNASSKPSVSSTSSVPSRSGCMPFFDWWQWDQALTSFRWLTSVDYVCWQGSELWNVSKRNVFLDTFSKKKKRKENVFVSYERVDLCWDCMFIQSGVGGCPLASSSLALGW